MAIFSKNITRMQRLMQDAPARDDDGRMISIASRHNHNRVSYTPPTIPQKKNAMTGRVAHLLKEIVPAQTESAPKKKITLKPKKESDQ